MDLALTAYPSQYPWGTGCNVSQVVVSSWGLVSCTSQKQAWRVTPPKFVGKGGRGTQLRTRPTWSGLQGPNAFTLVPLPRLSPRRSTPSKSFPIAKPFQHKGARTPFRPRVSRFPVHAPKSAQSPKPLQVARIGPQALCHILPLRAAENAPCCRPIVA